VFMLVLVALRLRL